MSANILIPRAARETSRSILAVSWLLLLRWGALICQALLVLAVYIFFNTVTPLPLLILIIVFEGGSNLAFHYHYQKQNIPIPSGLFGLIMFLDILLLTALLYVTGGPMNPFTFLFLIHITLGAILMQPRWAWALSVFTTLCYAVLFFLPAASSHSMQMATDKPVAICAMGDPLQQTMSSEMALHLRGMWLAFAITVFFVVFFVNKIQKDMEDYQGTLDELAKEKNRSEKLASLATLAAGAAHEFSTPLATIAVAAGEMYSTLNKQQSDQELIEDTMLIRQQVERCREILYQMSADAGEHLAEALKVFSVEELCTEALSWFPEEMRSRIRLSNPLKNMAIRVPGRTLKRIIRGLIKNGLDASDANSPITVTCRTDDRFLYIEVRDQGTGMDDETLKRAIEPFFTTKEPGKGLGLGLFLAESAAQRLGGSLAISSTPGSGTTATISFSLEQIQYT